MRDLAAKLFDRSAFMLAVATLATLVEGWFLPATTDLIYVTATLQVVLSIVVGIREGARLYS